MIIKRDLMPETGANETVISTPPIIDYTSTHTVE